MNKKDYLEALEGQEVISLTFEGVVGIKNGQIIKAGEVIDADPSLETLKNLFREMVDWELG